MIPQSATQPAPASPVQPDAQPENGPVHLDQALPESRPVPHPAAPVVVLDTNVCLDLFVFHDPRWNDLLLAMQHGRVRAVTRSDCRNEWQVVLGYRQLPLDEHSRAASMAAFDALITCGEFPPMGGIVLPRCTDGDDQKFLELARDAKAAWLISKDKALLKLARKTAQAGLFRIGLPQTWLAAQAPAVSGISGTPAITGTSAVSAVPAVSLESGTSAVSGASAASAVSAAPSMPVPASTGAARAPGSITTNLPQGRAGSGHAI